MSNTVDLTAFIVDDNPTALETLANDLLSQPEFKEVRTFSSYTEATLPFIEEQPDVIFLDIEVPEKTGLEFLQSIQPHIKFNFKTVFYTGYSEYMLNAIRLSAFDFLLKPYKQRELRAIIDRLTECYTQKLIFDSQLNSQAMPRKIAMQTVTELLLITFEQILMFNYSSSQRSWELTLTDMSTHQLKKGIGAADLLNLHPSLCCISNTSIVNLTYLAAVENTTRICKLCPPYNEIELIASRRYYMKLKEKFELI